MGRHLRWLLLLVGPVQAEEPRLVVKVNNQAHFEDAAVSKAEEIASRIFSASGVQLEWRNAADADRSDMLINLVAVKPAAMGRRADEAGIAAVPADGQPGFLIWIFRPLVEKIVDGAHYRPPLPGRERLTHVLLGHIMAHEIGHLLLHSTDHPDSGLMSPTWRVDKIMAACTGRLAFLPREQGKIRAAVQDRNRSSRPTASLPSSPRPKPR